jgi:hypothetical protein
MSNLKETYQNWYVIWLITLLLTIVFFVFLINTTWLFFTDWPNLSNHLYTLKTALIKVDAELIEQYINYIVKNDFQVDLLLHILIPFVLSFVISFTISLKVFFVKGGREKAIHINGAQLYKGRYAFKHAKKALRKELKNHG